MSVVSTCQWSVPHISNSGDQAGSIRCLSFGTFKRLLIIAILYIVRDIFIYSVYIYIYIECVYIYISVYSHPEVDRKWTCLLNIPYSTYLRTLRMIKKRSLPASFHHACWLVPSLSSIVFTWRLFCDWFEPVVCTHVLVCTYVLIFDQLSCLKTIPVHADWGSGIAI